MATRLYVGTYTHPDLLKGDRGPAGRAQGAYRLFFDESTGALWLDTVLEGLVNPSFLVLNAQGTRLYCVHETETFHGAPGGAVSALDISGRGAARRLTTRPSGGGAPCHLALSQGGLLCVSNYAGGSLSVFVLQADGSIGAGRCVRHTGCGPHPSRQRAPHVHSALFMPGGHALIAVDLGTDTLSVYPTANGRLAAEPIAVRHTRPGAGPRLCEYDGRCRRLYVACELSCQIEAYACTAQGVPQERLWAADIDPRGGVADGATAAGLALSPNGRFLYASLRGRDLLAVLALGEVDAPRLIQAIPCGTAKPRAIALSPGGGWLLCAGQDGDAVTVFAVDSEKGTLTGHDSLALPSPVCLAFAP